MTIDESLPLPATPSPENDSAGELLLGGAVRVLGPLGVGGDGRVTRAVIEHQVGGADGIAGVGSLPPVGSIVAAKCLHAPIPVDDVDLVLGRAARLDELAESTGNVVRPHFTNIDPLGRLTIVMPLCDGSLADRLRSLDRLPPDEVESLARSLGAALVAAHEHGIVHGDVSPANVLLRHGVPMLADFRLARAVGVVTHTGGAAVTLGYTAPEVIDEGRVGPAADAYSLGATLFHAATGTEMIPVQENAALGATVRTIRAGRRRPVPAHVAEPLRGVIAALTRTAIEDRASIADALDRLDQPISADRVERTAPHRRTSLRRPRRIAMAVAAVIVVAGVALAVRTARGDELSAGLHSASATPGAADEATTLFDPVEGSTTGNDSSGVATLAADRSRDPRAGFDRFDPSGGEPNDGASGASDGAKEPDVVSVETEIEQDSAVGVVPRIEPEPIDTTPSAEPDPAPSTGEPAAPEAAPPASVPAAPSPSTPLLSACESAVWCDDFDDGLDGWNERGVEVGSFDLVAGPNGTALRFAPDPGADEGLRVMERAFASPSSTESVTIRMSIDLSEFTADTTWVSIAHLVDESDRLWQLGVQGTPNGVDFDVYHGAPDVVSTMYAGATESIRASGWACLTWTISPDARASSTVDVDGVTVVTTERVDSTLGFAHTLRLGGAWVGTPATAPTVTVDDVMAATLPLDSC